MRNPGKTLAEHVAREGHQCLIPATHDRINECHYWWHELARNYHEPDPFRYSLGAFIQAARNVTFVLQAEKSRFEDFTWYKEWRTHAKQSTVLAWLHKIRTNFVHQTALEAKSWMQHRCIRPTTGEDEDEEKNVSNFILDPFQCTHFYIDGPDTDHPHEILRYWEIETLPGREILEASVEIFGELDTLVETAHNKLGARLVLWDVRRGTKAENLLGEQEEPASLIVVKYPCMRNTLEPRMARIEHRDGKSIWVNEPPHLHSNRQKSP